MSEELVLKYLRENRDSLNLKGIATTSGINQRTIQDYIDGTRGKRGLPPETVQALTRAIEGLRAPWAPQG